MAQKRSGKRRENKELIIKSRVSASLKQQVTAYALSIDENESIVVRNAVREYLRRHR